MSRIHNDDRLIAVNEDKSKFAIVLVDRDLGYKLDDDEEVGDTLKKLYSSEPHCTFGDVPLAKFDEDKFIVTFSTQEDDCYNNCNILDHLETLGDYENYKVKYRIILPRYDPHLVRTFLQLGTVGEGEDDNHLHRSTWVTRGYFSLAWIDIKNRNHLFIGSELLKDENDYESYNEFIVDGEPAKAIRMLGEVKVESLSSMDRDQLL